MSNLSLTEYDWTKHAAAVLNDDEVERNFADQAYSYVAQRATKLMQAPYFLGFEMIYANEEKTRLVGIFAFRANRDLFYAPVFFLNGQIRGQDMLYRCTSRTIVPLCEEWISFLLEKSQENMGVGIDRRRLDGLQTGVDLTPLIFPQRSKRAFWEENGPAHQGFNMLGMANHAPATPTSAAGAGAGAAAPAGGAASIAPPAAPVNPMQQVEQNRALGRSVNNAGIDQMVATPAFGSNAGAAATAAWGDQKVRNMDIRAEQLRQQALAPQPAAAPVPAPASTQAPAAAPYTYPIAAEDGNTSSPGVNFETWAPQHVGAHNGYPMNPASVPEGFTPDNMAAFQRAHGSAFNPKSRMDMRKMQTLMASSPKPAAPVAAPAASPFGAGQMQAFQQTHGSAFDPNSRVDMQKMQAIPKSASLPGFLSKAERADHAFWAQFIDENFCPKVASFAPEGLLRKFIIEDGGMTAFNAVAEAIKSSYHFAEAVMTAFNGDLEMALPSEVPVKAAAIKKASSTKSRRSLMIHFGGIKNAAVTRGGFEQTTKLGFTIEDNRKDDDLTKVYNDSQDEYESVSGPGLYEIPTISGSKGKALIADIQDLQGLPVVDSSRYGAIPCCAGSVGGYGHSTKNRYFGIIYLSPDKTIARVTSGKLLGRIVMEDAPETKGSETPAASKAYAVYLPKEGLMAADAIYVLEKTKNPNGTTSVVYATVNEGGISKYDIRQFIHNEDAPECDFTRGILNGEARFIELDLDTIPDTDDSNYPSPMMGPRGSGIKIPNKRLKSAPSLLPSEMTFDALVQVGMRKGEIDLLEDGRFLFNFGARSKTTETKAAAIAFLANDVRMHADAAADLVQRVTTKRASTFVLELPAKHASAVTRVMDRPDFTPDYDSYFGTALETPKSYALQTQTDQPPIREVGVNEVWDPAMGGNGNEDNIGGHDLLTRDPQQLAQLQKSKNTPHVFEHGVMGSLVKTFDAASMIEKYIPQLEAGLDRVGRMLFLFYWKPQDFEKAFGQDDMADFESELTSNFKSLGLLVLNVLKRNQSLREGSPSLS